jgi:hypothetical protein
MKRILAIVFLIVFISSIVVADEEYGEEDEAGYAGLAEFGFVLITIGIVLYSLVKRTPFIAFKKEKEISIHLSATMPFVKIAFPLSLLDIHHVFTIIGSLLTVPHFLSCNDYSTPFGLTGLLLGIVLLGENISGFYGRYLHGKIERLRRQIEHPLLKELLKKFRAWRTFHIAWTILLYLLLALHVAFAD